jgi:hypothetical protein
MRRMRCGPSADTYGGDVASQRSCYVLFCEDPGAARLPVFFEDPGAARLPVFFGDPGAARLLVFFEDLQTAESRCGKRGHY